MTSSQRNIAKLLIPLGGRNTQITFSCTSHSMQLCYDPQL